MSTEQSKMDTSFKYIQGRIAEAIIERLLVDLGFKVYRNGVESTFIMGNPKPKGAVGEDLARRPDFVAFDDNNTAYYLEVKYRTNGLLEQKEIEKYPENTLIVLVQPNALRICKKKDFPKFSLLGDVEPFSKNRKLVAKYVDFCEEFFN